MKKPDLENVFKQSEQHAADPAAKKRALAAAMQAFDAAQTGAEENNSPVRQGMWQRLRLIAKHNSNARQDDMKHNPQHWLLGGLAGASLVIFGGFIMLRTPVPFNQPETIEVPITSEEMVLERPLKDEQASATNSEIGSAGQATGQTDAVTPIPQRRDESLIGEAKLAKGKRLADAQIVGIAENESYVEEVGRSSKNTTLSISDKNAPAQRLSHQMMDIPQVASSPPHESVARPPEPSRDRFHNVAINSVKAVAEHPVSTFSVDVDTASYSFVRRSLNSGYAVNPDAVRAEEFINYFDYDYPAPVNRKQPFATHVMVGDSPWKAGNKLLHIGIQGYDVQVRPKSNLVFLLDVSGSMAASDKLPLVKQSIAMLLDQLNADDTVAIVVYAGAAGTVLEPTQVKHKSRILEALNNLQAGGSTAGAQGINLAYQLAEQRFNKEAVNRIVLATDGDFNVGVSDPEALKTLVEKKREKGVFLSILGFGRGNYHDALMQTLAQNGNGVAAYIDTLGEAQKVLVHEANGALFPIAKDVKIQLQFNPATVAEYRLIGYETRHLNREDFSNDKVDAGDIGAGHSVTAIYEITPVGSDNTLLEPSRYAGSEAGDDKSIKSANEKANEYALLRLRYKLPNEDASNLIEKVVPTSDTRFAEGNDKAWQKNTFAFSTAVAGFAQLLRNDKYLGEWSFDDAIALALASRGEDTYGYRSELVQLIRKAKIAR